MKMPLRILLGFIAILCIGLLFSCKVVTRYRLIVTALPEQDVKDMKLYFDPTVVRDADAWSTSSKPKMKLQFDLRYGDYIRVTITEARMIGIEPAEFEVSFIEEELTREFEILSPDVREVRFYGDRIVRVPADPSVLARLEVRGFLEKEGSGELVEFERIEVYGGSRVKRVGFRIGGGWLYLVHVSEEEHPLVRAYLDEIAKEYE